MASVKFIDILHNLKSNLGSKILQENHVNTLQMLAGESVHFLFWGEGEGEFVAVVFQISQNINICSMLGLWISSKSLRNTSPPPPPLPPHHHHHHHHHLANTDLGHLTISTLTLCTQ
jgi:hypothetical protein